VRLYTANGQRYFHIRNWKKHQKVDHPGKPIVPLPPEEEEGSPESLATPSRLTGTGTGTGTNDHDRDARGAVVAPSSKTPEPEQTDRKICCPYPLPLGDDVFVAFDLDVGLPRDIATAWLGEWARQQASDPSDLRTLGSWLKCAVKAARGTWSRDKSEMRSAVARAHASALPDPAKEARLAEALRQADAKARALGQAAGGGAPPSNETLGRIIGSIG
jgi:hypothetical protein